MTEFRQSDDLGRVVLPKNIREAIGITSYDNLAISVFNNDSIIIRKASSLTKKELCKAIGLNTEDTALIELADTCTDNWRFEQKAENPINWEQFCNATSLWALDAGYTSEQITKALKYTKNS